MADDRIQQNNDNIAHIPIFYGQPDKDTITLKYFVSRIDQGVSALTWTQKEAYVAFTNSLRGPAAHWFQYFTEVNRHNAQEWTSIKHHFCRAFGDTTVLELTTKPELNKDTSSNYNYASAITTNIERYLSSAISFPQGHTFSAAQILHMKGSLSDRIDGLCDDLKTYERQIDSMTQIMDIMVTRSPHQGNAKQKCAIKKFCIFCHKHNHEQEECRSRINKNCLQQIPKLW